MCNYVTYNCFYKLRFLHLYFVYYPVLFMYYFSLNNVHSSFYSGRLVSPNFSFSFI